MLKGRFEMSSKLTWIIALFFCSGCSFGKYFFLKEFIRKKKISANDVSLGFEGIPLAFSSLVIALYLTEKYLAAQGFFAPVPPQSDATYILIAVLISAALTFSYLFGGGYLVGLNNSMVMLFSFGKPPKKKCDNCGHLAFWADEEKCHYCGQPLSAN